MSASKQSSVEHERFMTQNSPIYFEIFLEKLDYIHPFETPETKPAQKRAGSTMHPSKTPDLAKNYTLSVNMAKEL